MDAFTPIPPPKKKNKTITSPVHNNVFTEFTQKDSSTNLSSRSTCINVQNDDDNGGDSNHGNDAVESEVTSTSVLRPVPVDASMYFLATPFGAYCSLCKDKVGGGFEDNVTRDMLSGHDRYQKKRKNDGKHKTKHILSYNEQANLISSKIQELKQNWRDFVDWESVKLQKENHRNKIEEMRLYTTCCGRTASLSFFQVKYDKAFSSRNHGMLFSFSEYVRM